MNRRHFITAVGGATTAASLLNIQSILGATTTTPFYAKGLIMISFEDPQFLRLGLPKAPGHKATLAMAPKAGNRQSVSLKGNYVIEAASAGVGKQDYKIPELIRMQEIYGSGIRSRVQECPTVISIPYAAIASITTAEVSPTRYTFVRSDNGQEITSFRPRKVAETLRIELSSDAVMKQAGKTTVALNSMKEIHAEYSPDAPATQAEIDAFTAHFPHYFDYLDRPANAKFYAVPKNLGQTPKPAPRVGNSFAPFYPWVACFVIGV
jgi:hypothetical protein